MSNVVTIKLQAYHERLAPAAMYPPGYQPGPAPGLLEHQVRTFQALEETPLVMNTYLTGTGKTRAALLRLLHPAQRGNNVLLIAPTNALLAQHVADVEAFVAEQQLDFVVRAATAEHIDALLPQAMGRPGTALHRLIENPALAAEGDAARLHDHGKPLVLVTNPDIFYLALYYRYGQLDRSNLFDDFLTKFTYVIIDEVHSYDSKQFACFLFFFGLLKEWGWLEAGRRLCLLSATPRPQVRELLDRLFTPAGWCQIDPANAPATPAAMTPVLAPLDLYLVPADEPIDTWVEHEQARITDWLAQQQDTVIISSSLARINAIHNRLRDHDPVRITGPEDAAERGRIRTLTLATSTVDIGYNFGRAGKARQSVDRLVCDARFRDDLLQRIGRAGRVLGRNVTTIPSEAWVLLPAEAAAALQPVADQSLERMAFNQQVAELDAEVLPMRHQLDRYLRSYALLEVMYPIYRAAQIAADQVAEMAEMFTIVRDLFAPGSRLTVQHYVGQIKTYVRRREWLQKPDTQRWHDLNEYHRKGLAHDLAAQRNWATYTPGVQPHHTAAQFLPYLATIATSPAAQATRTEVAQYVAGCVALMDALLSFRDGAPAVLAAVYDPQQIFSRQVVNSYDLLHLLQYYDLHWFETAAAFASAAGRPAAAETPAWVEVRHLLPADQRRTVGYRWTAPAHIDTRQRFEALYCREVVALHGLRLTLGERAFDGRTFILPSALQDAVGRRHLPALVIPREGMLYASLLKRLRLVSFVSRTLEVELPDSSMVPYEIVTGTAAFHMAAELHGMLRAHQRTLSDDEPIFC